MILKEAEVNGIYYTYSESHEARTAGRAYQPSTNRIITIVKGENLEQFGKVYKIFNSSYQPTLAATSPNNTKVRVNQDAELFLSELKNISEGYKQGLLAYIPTTIVFLSHLMKPVKQLFFSSFGFLLLFILAIFILGKFNIL